MPTIDTMEERTNSSAAGVGDAELLRRFIDDRDAAAMTAIIQRHGPLVMGLCRGILRNEQDAADAFQTTFLVLLKNAASIGKPASLSSWLHGVACRVALRARSQAARRRERESAAMASNESSHADNPGDAETLRLIHEELSNLPEVMRLPLILCCVEGASREDAARQLGWTLGSLKGRLERAREMLHRRLTRRGVVLSMAALTGVLAGQGAVKVPAALAASTVNSLVLVAAGKSILGGVVSANAAALTTGVLLSMKVAKVKIAAVVAVAVLLTAGTSVVVVQTVKGMIAARQQPAPLELATAEGVMILGAPAAGGSGNLAGGTFSDNEIRLTEPEAASRENLKKLGLAMHNYHDSHNSFPGAAIKGADGKPLLSWRVALLPFVEQADLYSQFKLDEPWDSPHNLALVERMPAVFDSPGVANKAPNETLFQVFTGPETVFPESGGLDIREIRDGTSQTLLIAEAGVAVPWTKPADLPYASNQPLPRLGGIGPDGLVVGGITPDGFLAVRADGSAAKFSHVKRILPEETLRAMITASGGEPIPVEPVLGASPTDALQTKVECQFEQTPLKDIAEFVSKVHQVPLKLDAGVDGTTPVTVAYSGSLKGLLGEVLPSLGLEYVSDATGIVIRKKQGET
jgi:RNA polymerase sigma factor (sigma-70 family)